MTFGFSILRPARIRAVTVSSSLECFSVKAVQHRRETSRNNMGNPLTFFIYFCTNAIEMNFAD